MLRGTLLLTLTLPLMQLLVLVAGMNHLSIKIYLAADIISRMCPGRWLAFQSIWIAVASILAVYDILLPLDEQGKEIKLPEEYTTGLLKYLLIYPFLRTTVLTIYF